MRFVLDGCASHPLAGLLRSRGYDADSAREFGRLSSTDVEVLTQEAETAHIFITATLGISARSTRLGCVGGGHGRPKSSK